MTTTLFVLFFIMLKTERTINAKPNVKVIKANQILLLSRSWNALQKM